MVRWQVVALFSLFLTSPAQAARDANGWLFVGGVRGAMLVGFVHAEARGFEQSQTVFGAGPAIDLGVGHAITPGLALAVEGTVEIDMIFARSGRLVDVTLDSLWSVGGAVVLHATPFPGEPFGWFAGAGYRAATFGASSSLALVPDAIFGSGGLSGPTAFAGAGWGFDLGIPWDLAVRADAAYLREPFSTSVVPVTLSARLSAFVF